MFVGGNAVAALAGNEKDVELASVFPEDVAGFAVAPAKLSENGAGPVPDELLALPNPLGTVNDGAGGISVEGLAPKGLLVPAAAVAGAGAALEGRLKLNPEPVVAAAVPGLPKENAGAAGVVPDAAADGAAPNESVVAGLDEALKEVVTPVAGAVAVGAAAPKDKVDPVDELEPKLKGFVEVAAGAAPAVLDPNEGAAFPSPKAGAVELVVGLLRPNAGAVEEAAGLPRPKAGAVDEVAGLLSPNAGAGAAADVLDPNPGVVPAPPEEKLNELPEVEAPPNPPKDGAVDAGFEAAPPKEPA